MNEDIKKVYKELLQQSGMNCYRNCKNVLSTEEAQVMLEEKQKHGFDGIEDYTYVSESIPEKRYFFFTDNYTLGILKDEIDILPGRFVPSVTYLPLNITPRETLEDGAVTNVSQHQQVFHKDDIQINTLDELVDFLVDELHFIPPQVSEQLETKV